MKRMTTHLTTMFVRVYAATTHRCMCVSMYVPVHVSTSIIVFLCDRIVTVVFLSAACSRLCGLQVTMLDVELIDVPAFRKHHSIMLCTWYATMGQGKPYALASCLLDFQCHSY